MGAEPRRGAVASERHLASLAAVLAMAALALTPVAARAASPPHFNLNGALLGSGKQPVDGWGRVTLEAGLGTVECASQLSENVWNPTGGGAGLAEVEAWSAGACKAPELEQTYPGSKVLVTPEMPLELTEQEAELCKEPTRALAECPASAERQKRVVFTSFARRGRALPWMGELVRGEREGREVALQEIGVPTAAEREKGHTSCYPTKRNASGEEIPAAFSEVPEGCVELNIVVPELLAEYVFYGTLEPRSENGFGSGLNASALKFEGAATGKLASDEGKWGEATSDGTVKIMGAELQGLITSE